MACEKALERLKEVKEDEECLRHGICPHCGGDVPLRSDDHGISHDRICQSCKRNFH